MRAHDGMVFHPRVRATPPDVVVTMSNSLGRRFRSMVLLPGIVTVAATVTAQPAQAGLL